MSINLSSNIADYINKKGYAGIVLEVFSGSC